MSYFLQLLIYLQISPYTIFFDKSQLREVYKNIIQHGIIMYLNLETREIISIRNMINKFYKKAGGNQITRKLYTIYC